jgi:alkylation response protein AidB-like acyl-CoA dehydrogenase
MSATRGAAAEGARLHGGTPVERVRALLPAIAAAADRIDRERRVPAALMAQLHDARLFRLLLPKSCGGEEADPVTFMEVLELISGAEASVAWNLCQNSVCATVAAYLPPETAREMWSDPAAILAWGPPVAECRAVPAPGGYRISGSWSFASGGRHASWLGAQCTVAEPGGGSRRGPDGAVEQRTFFVPDAAVQFTDTWDVIGLRGTASDTFSVKDLFVPEARSLVRDDRRARRESGRLYRMTTLNLFAAGFGSVALGVARTMLDAFMRLALEKTPRASGSLLRDNAEVQSQLGQAEAEWRAARLLLRGTLADIWDALGRGGAEGLTMEQRIAIRMASTHAIHTARRAAQMAYETAGANAIFAANPFEKPFRDLHTIAQQVQGRRAHFQSVGKFMLGLEPETAFL